MSTEAQKAYAREYYQRNREKIVANVRAYREANLEVCRKRCRDYYAANSERLIEANAAYRATTAGILTEARHELRRATQRLESL